MKLLLRFATTMLFGISVSAQSTGIVVDPATNQAILFDGDSYQSLGSVALPPASTSCFGDCVINAERTLAYVTGATAGVTVIDLTTRPPTLAAGTNPIPISRAPGGALDITPDGRFLVIAGIWVMSVDLATRTEVSTLDLSASSTGIDASLPGSVHVTMPVSLALRRLLIAADGSLSFAGEQINVLDAHQVDLVQGGQAGVCAASLLRSFTTSPLTLIDSRPLADGGSGLTLAPDGKRVCFRTSRGLECYAIDPVTAQLGSEALFQLRLPSRGCFDVNPAFHADGTRLFVPTREQVLVLDANDGHLLGLITDPAIVNPRGISVRSGTEAF